MQLRLLIIALLLALAACAPRSEVQPPLDLVTLQQDAGVYHGLEPDTRLLTEAQQNTAYKEFLTRHFGPWDRTEPEHSADTVFWGLSRYADKNLYGENTLLRSPDWFARMRENCRVPEYPSMNRSAIAVTNTSMRTLPTNQPAFYNPAQAGEGFPFDYMQTSLILAGAPLNATHMSADREWIMVESRHAFGWVRARDLAWVTPATKDAFRNGQYAAFTQDDVSLITQDDQFRIKAHIGTVLPIKTTHVDGSHTFLVPTRKQDGMAALEEVTSLVGNTAQAMPIPATPANFAKLANNMLGRQYGWGGLYENRDCSALTLDLMAGFGIYLPRNSTQQIKHGGFMELRGLTYDQKKQAIAELGTPFLTLVRKPGHIMLYIGKQDDQPVILHAAWGMKTKVGDTYGREVIGRAVITTLEPGADLKDLARPSGVYLENISGMSTLP